jgi:DNA-binding NtrC family response regulator
MPAPSILIVEDVVQLAEIVQELLEAEGYRVQCVHSYEAALKALREHTFDLLLTDANLGPISGIELIRKSQDICPGINSVLMSGHPVPPALEGDPVFRRTEFLNKPFTPAELFPTLRRALVRPRD